MAYSTKREKTKGTITDAFMDLFKTRDLAHITVKDVCSAAGINRSTFYTYFSDVYEVKEHLESSVLKQIRELVMSEVRDFKTVDINDMLRLLTMVIKSNNGFPFLLVKRGDAEFVHRVAKTLVGYLSDAGFEIDEEIERTIRFCMIYHITGVAALLAETGCDDMSAEFEKLMPLVASIANEGPVTVVKKII